MAEKAFQPVNMTSVCDDVTLTIREALVDEKSIYLILDYQLPDSVDPETVEIAYNSRENTQKDDIKLPMVTYYATDDIAWEDLKAAVQDTWATLDWTDPLTRIFYGKSESTLNRIGRVNGSSGLGETGYDPATNTLSYLCNITGDADSLDFTAQPLTLLVTPPVLRVNGVDTAVTNHPAILTFQPSAVSQTLTGSYRTAGLLRPGRPVPPVHLCGGLRRHRLSGYRGAGVGHLPAAAGWQHPASRGPDLRIYRRRQP